MVYINNTVENKVLEKLNDGNVVLIAFDVNKTTQLWKKGHPNYEGYFPLSNDQFLTAISSSKLGTKGKLSTDCRIGFHQILDHSGVWPKGNMLL